MTVLQGCRNLHVVVEFTGFLISKDVGDLEKIQHSLNEDKPDCILSQPADAIKEDEFPNKNLVPAGNEEAERLEESLAANGAHTNVDIELFSHDQPPADEKECLKEPEAPDSTDRFFVKKTGSTLEQRKNSLTKTKNHGTGKNWWYWSCALFILFERITCYEIISEQPLFSTILCNMKMEGFKTALPASSVVFAFTGLQMEPFCAPQVDSMNNPERKTASEAFQILPVCLDSEQPLTVDSHEPVCNLFPEITETQCPVFSPESVVMKEHLIDDSWLLVKGADNILQHRHVPVQQTDSLDESLDVSWFSRETKSLSEFLNGSKSRNDERPKQRPSGSKNGSTNTDSGGREDNPNELGAEQEQDTYRESGDTPTCSPSNGDAGATEDDGGGDDGDGDDGDGSRRGRDDGRFEINRTNERTNQTNHIMEALENFRSPNRARHDQWSLPHVEEESAAAEEHEGDVAVEEHVGDAAVEEHVGNAAAEEHVGDAAVEEHVSDAAAEEHVGDAAAEEHVGNAAVEEHVGDAAVEEHVGDAAAEEHVGNAAVEGHVGNAAAEDHVGDAAVEEHVGDAAVEDHVGDAAVEGHVGDAAVEENVGDAAAEEHVGDAAVEGHNDDAGEEHEGDVDIEAQNDDAEEQPNQAINIVNDGAFEPIPLIGFSVQEQGLDIDDHHYVDTEVRENRPIRSRVQSVHDDDDDED